MEEQELRLIEGLRNGDEHAYHELFVHHYEVLCHVALQIVGDAFLAESLVNDTIAHLWEIRQSLEIRSLLRAYLMRAVRNRCYNYIALESENREIAFSQKKELEEIGNNYAAEENPLGRLLEKELEKEIISSINRLDESCRRVFLKSRFEHKKKRRDSCRIRHLCQYCQISYQTGIGNSKARLGTLLDSPHASSFAID